VSVTHISSRALDRQTDLPLLYALGCSRTSSNRITPYPTGRTSFLDLFQEINCLATIIRSLRDKVRHLPIGRACFCAASQGLRCRCTTGPEAQTHHRVLWETKYSRRNAMVIPRLTAELGIASYWVTQRRFRRDVGGRRYRME